ncbi:MAG: heparan-alpha-glucosaminide N-acetyltransferase [Limnochordia bacterium]|jgi:uncharacterized membrane protein|nr:heparan-alpha-glucosaminide N-acetyltransferase [Limnochordia bacterium]NLO96270.1 DUF1624 domain-containing protein [Bacillota bacterium]HOB41312.1 heparan-alpha-glucosaminide N-acetyltransferase [Limnochordia bacterium]HOK32456.1 heparan-alpha-glucosaminide N-acetyltransferase [Limnochordia bacterium]HOM01032.1 heparan-alpha-glucosaminide N-acetyltransferase [Limnochordia bacterium]
MKPLLSSAAKPRVGQGRFPEIDLFRGLSVIAMVLFHLFWDLVYFDLVPWELLGENPLLVAWTIAGSFQLLAGISLSISYARAVKQGGRAGIWKKFVVRGLKLLAWAGVVSAAVYFTVDMPIFFGILHLIGTAIILAPLFLPRPLLAGICGLAIILATRWLAALPVSGWWLLPLGIGEINLAMADYYPLLPWLGVILLGIWLGSLLYPGGQRRFPLLALERVNALPGAAFIRLLGRHSLLIYLIHQPIVFGAVFGLHTLLGYLAG